MVRVLEGAGLSHIRPLLMHFVTQIDRHNLASQVLLESYRNLDASHEGLIRRAPKQNKSVNSQA